MKRFWLRKGAVYYHVLPNRRSFVVLFLNYRWFYHILIAMYL